MTDAKRFKGMTAVVTGGASGIGLTFARRFIAEGGRVTLWDNDPARLKAATAESATRAGPSALTSSIQPTSSARPRQATRRWARSTRLSARPEWRG